MKISVYLGLGYGYVSGKTTNTTNILKICVLHCSEMLKKIKMLTWSKLKNCLEWIVECDKENIFFLLC